MASRAALKRLFAEELGCHGPFIRHRTVAKRGRTFARSRATSITEPSWIGLSRPSAYHRRGQPGRVLCACTLKNCEAVSPPSGEPGAANSAILRWPRSGRCSARLVPRPMSTASGGVRCSRTLRHRRDHAPLWQVEARGVEMAGAVHGEGRRRVDARQDMQARQTTASNRHRAKSGRSGARAAAGRSNLLERPGFWRRPPG